MKILLLLAASALYGQTSPDPAEILKATQAKVRADLKRLPKYACLQTINRTYYAPVKPKHIATPCQGPEEAMRLTERDRLRLDVAQGTEREIYSWPGASRFDMAKIDQIVDHGPFGTGSFGGYLLDIFDNEAIRFAYHGEQVRDGKLYLAYDYSLPRSASHYQIRTYNSWTTTGYTGTVEIDPESLEIARVVLRTPQLPAETRMCETTSTLDYQRAQIGDGVFLLPSRSELQITQRDGEKTENVTFYSGCREYQAHSTIEFAAPAETPADLPELPAPDLGGPSRRYYITMRLNDTIDTDTAAAGDPVTATVVHDVHPYQSKEVVIPAGTVAHGRVSRIEHHFVPYDYLVIGISLQSLERNGQTERFSGRPVTHVAYSRVNSAGNFPLPTAAGPPTASPLARTPIPPAGSFVFPFEKHHVMHVGTEAEYVVYYPVDK